MIDVIGLKNAHLADVRALDARCFTDEPFADSWWHKAAAGQGACAWLLLEGDVLQGYCLFSRVLDEAELLRIAIAPEARQRGLGCCLLAYAESALADQAVVQLFLEVRASNRAAQQLYRQAGWQQNGRRKDYYPLGDGREDALLFSRELTAC